MNFEPSERSQLVAEQLQRFMTEYIYPNESVAIAQSREADDPHAEPPILIELRQKAKEAGLWNLFLPDEEWGSGLSTLEYAPLCEIMGRSAIASRVFNCSAPDTGNAEILLELGTEQQKQEW